MSLPGIRSHRGDAYQFQVALEWVVRLLTDPDVLSVQVESLGGIGEAPPTVDDVVVRRADRTLYVQAKKNHPKRRVWTMGDDVLRAELVKARDQLEADVQGEAWFYSQSPFGDLEQLCDEARYFPDYAAFEAGAPGTLRSALDTFAGVVERDLAAALSLVRRVRTKRTLDFEDWEKDVMRDLRVRYARPDDVADLLVGLIGRRHARLGGGPLVDPGAPITREDLDRLLRQRGHVEALDRPLASILDAFRRASLRGRVWKRDIQGRRLERAETAEVLAAIDEGAASVVVTSGAGGGKTCVLLDVVDRLEGADGWAVLFIKGDQYDGARTLSALADHGLPEDIVGQASRLSVHRRVAVVVDALDVLSLQRASGTLSLMLGLIDDLMGIEGVTVVAACRDFDLAYAPELRDREWARRVRVGPLQPDVVTDVLTDWGLDPETMSDDLRAHLGVPQHLRLFGQLVANGVTEVAGSPYALHDRFLDVVVEGGDGLGTEAMEALYAMAERLQKARSLALPRSAFPGPAGLAERLLSVEVLTEARPGVFSFSHQEILDCVAVRGAVRRGDTLLGFLRGRPALPFVRPTARTFLFMLRARDAGEFRRQVRRTLDDGDLAYHLRRLIAESLAEVTPEVEDVRLVRFLMRRHLDLFERFASRLKGVAWLDVTCALLDEAWTGPDAERWAPRLLTLLNVWAAEAPEPVLDRWRAAMEEGRLRGPAWGALAALQSALKAPEGSPPLPAVALAMTRLLLDEEDPHGHQSYGLTEVVQGVVTALDAGDDVVCTLMERITEREGPGRGPRDFEGTFLEDRLSASDVLMDWAYRSLLADAEDEEVAPWSNILNATSYTGRHNRGMMASFGDRALLVGPFERALVRRARRGDAWWLAHADALLHHKDLGLNYLALLGYGAAPETHAREIAAALTNPTFLGRHSMRSEVWELAYAAYPFLTNDEREAHQIGVLATYEPDENGQVWRAFAVYESLLWVPRPWRTAATNAFVDAWERTFGPWRSVPDIRGSGGMVPPPFGSDDLLSLDADDMARVALFFGTEGHSTTDGWGNMIGSWDQAVGVYREAASRAPVQMARVLDTLIEKDVSTPYLDAVVDGLGDGLRYRFGNSSLQGWEAVEEHADGEALGWLVLRVVERYGDASVRVGHRLSPPYDEPRAPWLREGSAANALAGCAHVLTDADDVARLVLWLVRLSFSPDPEAGSTNRTSTVGLNSVRGKVAEAAVQTAGALLSEGEILPSLLVSLLERLASDPIGGVRWMVVQGLPYLTQFDRALGWKLAEQALAEPDAGVWEIAERQLYYNYHSDWARVRPFLNRLRESRLAPETWGRIAMLSALAGHLDGEAVLVGLAEMPAGAWKGVAQVLVANLASASSRERCQTLLLRLLRTRGLPEEAVTVISGRLDETVRPFVTREIIDALVGLSETDEHGFRWRGVAEWIEAEAVSDPWSAAEIMERVAGELERTGGRGYYGGRDELGRALNAVLRDADESDDSVLIRRAVRLQDALFRLHAVNETLLFEASARR